MTGNLLLQQGVRIIAKSHFEEALKLLKDIDVDEFQSELGKDKSVNGRRRVINQSLSLYSCWANSA